MSVVNATGTLKPVLSVWWVPFVSGPVKELHAEFNQEVTKGTLLAKIDPRIYEATVAQNRANSHSRRRQREADVERAKALLQQAINNEKRAVALREEDETFVAEQEMDSLRFNRLALEAQVKVAEAAVAARPPHRPGLLEYSETQLEYTNIYSPVDGIVIDRKIDPGQTLAAQFQTPELFVVAPDMREKMHVYASVDEADIGLIREAQQKKEEGRVHRRRLSGRSVRGQDRGGPLNSTTTQNVVTYPVVVAAAESGPKLLPGMTASISFQVDERKEMLKIPNAALRFYPNPQHVREADRKLLEGSTRPGPARRSRTTSRRRRSRPRNARNSAANGTGATCGSSTAIPQGRGSGHRHQRQPVHGAGLRRTGGRPATGDRDQP